MDICEKYTSTQIYFDISLQSRVSTTLHFVSSTNKMEVLPKILFYIYWNEPFFIDPSPTDIFKNYLNLFKFFLKIKK